VLNDRGQSVSHPCPESDHPAAPETVARAGWTGEQAGGDPTRGQIELVGRVIHSLVVDLVI